jgi:acyl-CoA thioesterase FadM
MARVRLDIPETLPFATEIRVRVTDLNYRGHVGGDTIVSLLHEARVQYLRALGFEEHDCGGVGLILADAAVVYRSEAFAGEVLRVAVGAADLTTRGFDVVFRVADKQTGREVALAKTGMVCFDYEARQTVPIPSPVRAALER